MPKLKIFGVTVMLVIVAHMSQARADPIADVRAALAADARGDYAAELKLLQPLAKQGNAIAQALLGISCFEGHGVPKDYAEALR